MARKLLIFFLFLPCCLMAQESLSYGIDEGRDSVAFARFRQRMDSIRAERPTVALVLSGGGAKGAAHIRVIQYLERQGIPIDLVMGTSIGGLVGGLYACGYDGEELEAIIRNQDWDYLLRDTHPRSFDALQQKDYDRQYQLSIPFGTYRWDFLKPENDSRSLLRDGIVLGRNIEDLFSSLLIGYGDECDFLQLPTPFVCVATDMISAKPKVWHSGNIVQALRSTMSIPGLFTPVRTNNMVLMDGSMRSNFPAEIARQLGADYIIGVDISTPALKANQMRKMFDVVYQATDMLGREAYDKALATTDIYIQPELSDFMLRRGEEAVLAHADEIEMLKERLHIDGKPENKHRRLNIRKATDLCKTPVAIKKITFSGISEKEERYLRRLLGIVEKEPQTLHTVWIENAISTIIGTKAFEKVTYKILGDSAAYTVQFDCFRSPQNQFGASVRFDSRDYASILLHAGFGSHRLTGSCIDLTARLGLDTRVAAAYTLRNGRGIELGARLSYQAARNGEFRVEPYEFRIDFDRASADVHLSLAPWRRMNLQLGYRIDHYLRTNLLSSVEMPIDGDMLAKSNLFDGPYASLRHDSFDDPYFPSVGMLYSLSYNWHRKGLLHTTPDNHATQASLRWAYNLGALTLLPAIDARYVSDITFPFINMLSVSDANRTLEQQITFIGISTPATAMRTLGSVALAARVRMAKNHYLTATMQMLHESDSIKEFVDSKTSESFYGVALEYAYNTIAGPLRLRVHWSDLTKSIGFYLGIGLDF